MFAAPYQTALAPSTAAAGAAPPTQVKISAVQLLSYVHIV